MIPRPFWIDKLNKAWTLRSIVWLSGVRRSGKTTLSKMIPGAYYYNCDLPSVQRQLEDPEFFYNNLATSSTIIFDEIHQIDNPDNVLKIGADEFPHLKILATGSSTLSATKKFRDALTGRKLNLFFPPVLWNECVEDFKINEIDKRLLFGGLPEFLLSDNMNHNLYSEWIDSYYARDIQELFNVRNRNGFLKLLHVLFLQSSGQMEITGLAKTSGLSRPTVISHLEALQVAHAINVVLPFFGGGKKEITKRPKVYAFDTGFVTFVNGWNEIRDNERGFLWEHLVLDMLKVRYGEVFYWQNKNKNEIDFVVRGIDNSVHTFECKINPEKFDPKVLLKFREFYPDGKNYCFAPHIKKPYKSRFGSLEVEFISTAKI
ncbi:MAG TPA: ATP-binding protein [Bacteroidetes bacterium]|nr:ATP-binding protein [Bacteroidota bacterium]